MNNTKVILAVWIVNTEMEFFELFSDVSNGASVHPCT